MASKYQAGRFYNNEHAYVPTIRPESAPPFTITREFTQDEIDKSADLRNSIDRGYLIPYDAKVHGPAYSTNVATKKPAFTTAPDSLGGPVVKKKTGTGFVEYISAVDQGVDGVSTPGLDDGVIASLPEQKSADHIETPKIAPEIPLPDDVVKDSAEAPDIDKEKPHDANPKWKNASEAYEAELKEETTQDLELDDETNLSEQDPERQAAPDADDEISADYTRVFEDKKKQGASLRPVKDVVEEGVAKGVQQINEAVSKASDDSERVAKSGVSRKTVDFLRQNFSQKKWLVGKETDTSWLQEVRGVTQSGNLRSVVEQRLSELKPE